MIQIKVLYFSSIKDKLDKASEEIQIDKNITLQELLEFLSSKYPQLKEQINNVMIAVNEEYQDKSYKLKDKDVVALIPPVSGG